MLARPLQRRADTLGNRVHRYFFAHRVGVRVSDRLNLGLWETVVLAGVDRSSTAASATRLSLLLLANQYRPRADGNVMLGSTPTGGRLAGLTLEAQLGLDDLQYEQTPDRRPLSQSLGVHRRRLRPAGPKSLGWRALYTQASSLAFRTMNPFENFTDGGVGIGRNFDDQDQLTSP